MRRADAKNARIRLAPRRIRLARIVGHSLEKYAETLNDVLLSTNIADQRRLRPHAQGRRPVTQDSAESRAGCNNVDDSGLEVPGAGLAQRLHGVAGQRERTTVCV